MTLNFDIVSRAVTEARQQPDDRIQVSLSGFTYGYWRPDLLDLQRKDGHVEYLIDQRVPSGQIELRNMAGAGIPEPHLVDCRVKARHA